MDIKPPLKWAGGKRWLVPKLLPIWQPHAHRRLVEPFAGGMAVTLGLRPKKALVNDINKDLINFYSEIQTGWRMGFPDDPFNAYRNIALENTSDAYYQNRTLFNAKGKDEVSPRRKAILFYYLNRTGFNGLCRYNKSGGFNVPFGKYKNLTYRKDFPELTELFQDYSFTDLDFEGLSLLVLDANDFIYADPPYDATFTAYSAGGFSWDDQVRLANWLAKHPGPVVASNSATDRIIDLYTSLGFTLEYIDVRRSISCDSTNRVDAKEILATKNL